jgi:hypothetical protein
MTTNRLSLLGWLTCLALTSAPTLAQGDEKFYVVLVRLQNENNSSHAFALFFKTSAAQDSLDPDPLENQTMRRLTSNYKNGNPSNMAEVLERNHSVRTLATMWGPYLIKKDVYDQERKAIGPLQGNLLESILAEDPKNLRSIADSENSRDPRLTHDATCLLVVRRLEPWFLPPGRAPDWIGDRKELKEYGAFVRQVDR